MVELTNRGSMTTLHVVCINFELRFRVHFGEWGCTQILITLIGFGFLRPVSDQYTPAERTSRRIVQHVFEQLVTVAMRNGMIYMRIRIDDLSFIGDSHIAHQQFGLRPFSYDNQQPAIHHKIDIAPKDIYQLYRFFHDDSVRNIQKEAVLGKSRVQGNGPVSFHIGDLSVITRYQIGVLQGHVTKATHQNAVREFR